jgi:hypothetical protein
MRRLPALLLACAVLLVVCVPTTHALDHDPGKPTADRVFQPEKPAVADDGAWVETKSGAAQSSVLRYLGRILTVYFNAFVDYSPLTNYESEATPSHDTRQPSHIGSSGSTR